MPITKSAKKALRQSEKKHLQNNRNKRDIKDSLKEFKVAIAADPKEAEKIVPKIYKTIDKAAKKGVLSKNTAARKKSVIMKTIVKKTKIDS
jgi:small subunit ribosomal protein S20